MARMLLVTLEILLVVVAPLLILYLRGKWPLRVAIPCLLVIPVFWYLTYSPLHELSHLVATYLVGGRVVHAKLIPSFWVGEFGRAWLTTEGLSGSWQRVVMTSAPYMLDAACVVAGLYLLRRGFTRHAFVIGFLFMLLCLRPMFDFVCETVAFALGDKGDFYHAAEVVGSPAVWSLLIVLIGLSAYTIASVLGRFAVCGSEAGS
jgi:hypothetical protein